MCLFMGNAISNGEFLQPETGPIGIGAAGPPRFRCRACAATERAEETSDER